MRRIGKRHALTAVVVAAVVTAFAVPAATVQAGSGLPTKIGKGEGRLNVIEWPAYTDKSFAKKFERQTGCIIHRRDAGSSSEMFALMHANGGGGGGQYDLVSASGDASLRLIYAHDVKAINIHLIPSWKQFLPAFKSPPHNTVNGVHYGVSVQWGPNTLIYNTKKVKPAPKNWSVIYGKKYRGHVTVPNNPIQIADAALYLEQTKPSLGIKDPYELTQAQLAATVKLLLRQKPLLKRYWNYATDEDTSFKNGDVWLGAGWPYQTLQLQANHVPVKEIVPVPTTGWADTWMLASKAPHPNCAYKWMRYVTTPRVEAKQALVFGETPVNPLACKYMNRMQKGSCAGYHLNEPASYYKKIKFWKTPIPQCGWTKTQTCTDYNAWVLAWKKVTG
ncbi:MAG TPA: extracellular solute-binding protein [Gaiellaceae bacterium]|nr:extracellular solute-binding protein [Gaiellaceae bacterium]